MQKIKKIKRKQNRRFVFTKNCFRDTIKLSKSIFIIESNGGNIMKTRIVRALAIFIVLLSCLLTFVACDMISSNPSTNKNTQAASTGDLPSEKDTSNKNSDDEQSGTHTHSFSAETTTVLEATCTEKGKAERVCECGEKEIVEIDALGHAEVIDEATPPTCTEEGISEGKHCSRCNEVLLKQEPVAPTGHTEAIDAAVEPTCTEEGLSEGKHCSVCKEILVKQEPVAAKGHTEAIDAAVAPTCTEEGLSEGKHCSVCKEVLVKQEPVKAKGHTEYIEKGLAPTCTEDGMSDGKRCSVCKEVLVKQEVLKATGHDEVIDKAKEPTCTEYGLTEGKHCSKCKKVFVNQERIKPNGHTEVIDKAKEPTCTESGLTEGKHCSVCKAVLKKQNVIDANGHTEVIDKGREATCTVDGLSDGKHCSVCKTILKKQTVIVAKGHTEVIQPAVEPSCDRNGYTEGKYCSVCKEILVEREDLGKTKHDYSLHLDYPTWDERGSWTTSCSICKDEKKEYIALPLSESLYGYNSFAKLEKGEEFTSFYRKMYDACNNFHLSTEDFKEDTIKLSIADSGLTREELISVWKVFYLENPQFYWISNKLAMNNLYLLIKVDPAYESYEERKKYDEDIQKMIYDCGNILVHANNDLEKAMLIHDFIAERVVYAYNDISHLPENATWAHSIVGASTVGKGVCECYAKTYLYLCEMYGIECVLVSGKASGGDHAWNLVNIDGKWYNIDLTWNDDMDCYAFFGIPESIFSEQHTADTQHYGQDYLYALPDVSNYELQLVTLYKGKMSLGMFGSIEAAFEAMTDKDAHYTIELFDYFYKNSFVYQHELRVKNLPDVKSITFVDNLYTLPSGNFATSELDICSDLILNSNLILENIRFIAHVDTQLDLNGYTLTTEGYYCSLSEGSKANDLHDFHIFSSKGNSDHIDLLINTDYQTEISATLDLYRIKEGSKSTERNTNSMDGILFENTVKADVIIAKNLFFFRHVGSPSFTVNELTITETNDSRYSLYFDNFAVNIKNLYSDADEIFGQFIFDSITNIPKLSFGKVNTSLTLYYISNNHSESCLQISGAVFTLEDANSLANIALLVSYPNGSGGIYVTPVAGRLVVTENGDVKFK